MNENKEQYVYVMSNPSFPEDVLKIGWTRYHPVIRAKDLHTSGIPTPFNIEFIIITQEGCKLEKKIHEHIKKYRVNSNREFFKIPKNELAEILKNELTLKLQLISEINAPINIKKCNKVDEIKILYEDLKKEADEFFSKVNKQKTKLVITEKDNNKTVTIRELQHDVDSLEITGWENDKDEIRIKRAWYWINRNIIDYAEWLRDLVNNYEEIKNRIGITMLRHDNKDFKERILKTHNDLDNLNYEYEWVV